MPNKEYYWKNRELMIKKATEWNKNNLERHQEIVRRYDAKHRLQKRMRSKKRITFMDKRVVIQSNPRTGQCSECGEKRLTNMHHEKYDISDPLAFTRELCVECHMRLHNPNLRQRGLLESVKKVGRYTWIDGKKPDWLTDDGKIDIWYLEEIKKIKVNEI